MSSQQKIALISGANKGLGFETARQLAQQNIFVLMGARDPRKGEAAAQTLKAAGLSVEFLPLDVNQEASILEAKQQVETRFGRLDILINNAGIMPELGMPVAEVPPGMVRQTYETNVFGPVAMIHHFLPLLKAAPEARVVNVSSGLGSLQQNTDPDYEYYPFKLLAYNSSKAALNAATIIFAHELKDTQVKINSADPGYCATDLNGKTGPRSPQQGVQVFVRLATLPEDGPTGGFFDEKGQVPW